MAQTATYTEYANGGKQPHYEGKVTFSIVQNIEGNYFTVSYWYWLYRDDGFTGPAHNFTNGNKLLVYINGDKLIDDENYKTVTLTGTSAANPFLMCSGQHKVPANTDGSKTFAFSFMYDQTQDRGQELDYLTVAGEHKCEPIPRATTPTLSDSDVQFGETVTITTNRASTSFTHTLRYAFGNASETIATGVITSQSWTVPLSLMNQIPNATSGNITIYCDTYNGSDLIGTKTVTLKATVPSSIVPTLSIAIAEAAYIPSNILGYVQNKSKVKVTSTAAGTYKSTIKSYAVTVDGTPYTGATVTSNTLTNSGTITIKVVVTDSRGRTATVTEKITVATYSNPKITSTSAFRCASATDPTSNPQGEYICVQPRGSISPLSNQNGRACRVYYKKTGASSYSSVAVTMSDYVLDSEYVIFAAAGDSSYDIYTTLSDSFSSSEFDTPDVQTTAIPIDFLMDAATEENVVGIAVGKQVEVEESVDFGWKTIFRKAATFYGDVYGQILMLNHIPDEVGENGNLNDVQYLIPGMRAIRQTATAKTISNIPQPVAGIFITYSAIGNNNTDTNRTYYYARQEFIPYDLTYGRYERSVYSSATAGEFTYGAWKRIAYTDSTVATAITANALKSGIDINVNDIDAEHIDANSTISTKAAVEIFATTPHIDFHFADTSEDYTARIIENSSGVLTAYNSISSASDERLKKDFAEIPEVYLDLVDALNPELFRFKSGDTYLNVGLVAQKVLDMEAFFGITESVLVRGTGMEIPDPKNPDKVMADYYSIDYQAYNILRGMALERKMNRIISALGIVI